MVSHFVHSSTLHRVMEVLCKCMKICVAIVVEFLESITENSKHFKAAFQNVTVNFSCEKRQNHRKR